MAGIIEKAKNEEKVGTSTETCRAENMNSVAYLRTYTQGCQIFLDTIYQNGRKYIKLLKNYQMTIMYTNGCNIHIPNGRRLY
jgi:hypothetical protein